jgi:hypothetical protein
MPLSEEKQKSVLSNARSLIGLKYSDVDCSHFVHRAYEASSLSFPYKPTAQFAELVGKEFESVDTSAGDFMGADVLMFDGHMGLWDPKGCSVLQASGSENDQCKQFDNALPFLSSRSGKNRGPDFGMLKWFGALKGVYRWKG